MQRRVKAVFITGTDTGVGKTVITGLLGRYCKEKNYAVITQKWVQTGALGAQDFDCHLKLMNLKKEAVKDYLSCTVCFRFKRAYSPHLAAFLEKKRISSRTIEQSFKTLIKKFDFVIVEGAGGALVPFNSKNLLIDIVKELKLPVVIVAENKLGAINHTLLTIEAVKSRGIKIIGIIFNSCGNNVDTRIAHNNPKIVRSVSKEKVLGSLPFIGDKDLLYEKFKPIAAKVMREMR